LSVEHPPAEHATGHHPALAHHFDNLEQQTEAATLGMWVFLATEVMIFGGLFTGYLVYRWLYPVAWAQASSHLLWVVASVNTVVLLSSSFTVVLAVYGAQTNNRRLLVGCLVLTLVLGLVFLVLKFYEYAVDYHDGLIPLPGQFNTDVNLWSRWTESGVTFDEYTRQVKLFYILYFVMTGLHATHMIVGMAILVWLIAEARKGRFTPEYHPQVELFGLYWHFVDIIWIFLLPLLYLIGH
jgi:cytochrome c oxidase subunit 3